MKLTRVAAPLAVAGAMLLSLGMARADTITLRADEWCPYNCTPGSDKPGYGIEIAQEIFTKAGHKIDYQAMPWARALDECRKGGVMAVIGTSVEESPDFVFPKESMGLYDNTFLVKKGNAWRYESVASLEKLKLGIIQGYGYNGELAKYVETNGKNPARVEAVAGDNALEQNLKKLAAGRIDVTADAQPVLAYKMKQLNLSDKLEFAGSADPTDGFIAFSPANPKSKEYAAILDKGMAEMRSSGRLKQILDRYGVKDWK